MNASLCRYPAQQIYVPEYQPASAAIGARRLRLGSAPADTWPDLLVDPEDPLVVCVTEGVQAAVENRIEANLVATAALRIRTEMLDVDGSPYPASTEGDARFWDRGLFIVSPHHAQIHAIRRELEGMHDWLSRPFVDTVDKMQGQECDAVIVSYGVSDVEYALAEREFIYSLNRLNVAITRARMKTIVFLSRPLLEPPVAAFEDDRIAEGIGFMQGLWRFAERNGVEATHDLPGGGHVRTYAVPA